MKKILIFFIAIALLAAVLAVSLSACAAKTPTEGLEIEVSEDGSHAVVKGIDIVENATEIILPSVYQGVPVTEIGQEAFIYCSNLTNITIPDSVTTIGKSAFEECSNLTSINIPNGVTSIGERTFSFCSSLTTIAIPESVTSIGKWAFERCSSLISIEVAADNPVYHSAGNCLIETKSKTLIAGCQNSIIPNDGSVITIGDDAFYRCISLTSITIPESVTTIGDDAFYRCVSLMSITVPESVTTIGNNAFEDCVALVRAEFKNPNGWYDGNQAVGLSDPAKAAEILKSGSRLYKENN